MANPTTNFGWVMPTSTDLVTDLPADFAVFGQAVDTSMADLKGGTTGQILAKATNTDMDFTWVTNDVGDITAVTAGTGISGGGTSGAVTITNSMATEITAKGDLIAGTGSATFDNLPVGTNGQTLVADSTASTGLKWATPAGGGGKVLQVIMATTATEVSNSTTTLEDSGITATITPTLNTSKVLVLVTMSGVSKTNGNSGSHLIAALLRGATNVLQFDAGTLYTGVAETLYLSRSFNYLDSPATTSATTYKVKFSNAIGAAAIKVQADNANTSTIILLEIGA